MSDAKLPVFTVPRWQAAGRHVVTFVAGAGLATAGAVAFLQTHGLGHGSVDQLQSIGGGFKALADGLTTVFGAVATIAGGVSALYGVWAAGPIAQAKAVINNVPGTAVIAPPVLADKVDEVHSTDFKTIAAK